MGTYFALMDEAVKHGEEYQGLDRIRDILHTIQSGDAKPKDIEFVIKYLDELHSRVYELKADQPAAVVEEALQRVKDLQSALVASLNAVHS